MPVIRIEGRGAEALTRLAAKACFYSGFAVQSFTLQSTGYVKFDKKPVVSRQEEFSDYLLIADGKSDLKAILRSAKEKSVVIINTGEKPRLPEIKKRKLKIYIIDAASLAEGTSRPMAADIIMMGALVKACDKITAKAGKLVLGDNKELHLVFEEGFRNAK